jgi:peptidyl-tRNA hydrolase, PTH1 family
MKLIVGLGNPGEKYEKTRHNLGFMVLEQFLKDATPVLKTVWDNNTKLKSDIYSFEWDSKKIDRKIEKVILAKPKTYMNNSGLAVTLIANFYKVAPSDIWIINDELDLPLGAMKIRFGGSGAGHHGIESIIEKLGTDKFWRIRLGIGQAHSKRQISKHMFKETENYVLDTFAGKEASQLKKTVKRAAKAIADALEEGIEASQNRYNTK